MSGRACIYSSIAALAIGCASAGEPKRVCVSLSASPSLNLYDGEPHAITLSLYPLDSSLDFEQISARDLLEGRVPSGTMGDPVKLSILPGESRSLDQEFSPSVQKIGLVASYYRAPGAPEGQRKAVVPAECGFLRSREVFLSRSDVVLK